MGFKANITVLHHPTTIRENYEPVIHCGKIAQSAIIEEMNRDKIRTGDKATIKFRFKYRPEFIEKEDILVFREGENKRYWENYIITLIPQKFQYFK